MQRSATDADPMNDAQLETELNMIQERRAAEMKDVAKMDARLAALAEEKAKIAARRAAAMGEVAKMDSRTAEIKGQRASRAATSRASASSASLRRKPTLNEVDRAADLAGDSPSPENELKKQYKIHKAQCAAQLAELALAPASSDSAANDAELNGYLHRVEHRGPPAPNRFEPAQTRRRPSRNSRPTHTRLRRRSNSTWPTARSRTRTGRSLWRPTGPRQRRRSGSTWPTARSRTRTGRSLWTPRSRAPLRLARCTRPGVAQW